MSFYKTNNTFHKKLFKYGIYVLSVVIIIGVWGYFYGISKVPWPTDNEKFPEWQYENASEKYKDVSINYLDNSIFNQKAKDVLSSSAKYLIESWKNEINLDLKNKIVFLQVSKGNYRISGVRIIFETFLTNKKNDQEKLKNQLTYAGYFKRQEISSKLRVVENTIRKLENLLDSSKDVNIEVKTDLIFGERLKEFDLIAGKFSNFIHVNNLSFLLYLKDARPVTKSRFFKDKNKSSVSISSEIINHQKALLRSIKVEAKQKFLERKRIEYKQTSEIISRQRKPWRNTFYEKWYSVLLMLLISIGVGFILLNFLKFLKRKKYPVKSDFDVYLGLNTTVKIFYWLSITAVYLAVIPLLINLLNAIAQSRVTIQDLFEFGFLYALVSPVVITLSSILLSWLMILISEILYFITNIFYINFEKSKKYAKGRML